METKYRLLKPTWRHEVGFEVKQIGLHYYSECSEFGFTKDEIENNPEWWALVEENKVIEFESLADLSVGAFYGVTVKKSIPPAKYSSIIAAIEKELNS